MQAPNLSAGARRRNIHKQSGVAALEFALVAVYFFLLVFGILDLARYTYMVNTLQEVTRRAATAAVNTDFSNPTQLDHIRQSAIFRDSAGKLTFGDPITDEHVRIDYMYIEQNGSSLSMKPVLVMPSSPAQNLANCMTNPNCDNCIRLVRAQVCEPGSGSSCDPVHYNSLFSILHFSFTLPTAPTIMTAETLGLTPGMAPSS
jgi:Flp pilus assembly protein TadG